MAELLKSDERKKVWLLNGKEVTVFNASLRCKECGRPLSNEFSIIVGRGPRCRQNHRQHPPIIQFMMKLRNQ